MVILLGIDPGFKGALAFLDTSTRLVAAHAMPTEKRSNGKTYLDAPATARLIESTGPDEAWIEDVYSSPQMGVTSAFSFGEGKGVLVGVLAALRVPVRLVAPSVWKGKMGLTSDKDSTKRFARALFAKSTLSTEGKCEAALIAQYGALARNLDQRTVSR